MKWTQTQDAALLAGKAAGRTLREIAAELGVTREAARCRSKRLIGADIPVEWEPPHHEDPKSRLEDSSDVERLVKLTKRGLSLEELCDRLDRSPGKVRELIAKAQAAGFVVDVDGPLVGRRPAEENFDTQPVAIQAAGDRRIVGQFTDLHLGSRYHLGPQMCDFVKLAYARGVRTMLCTGDMLEGCYKHAQWQLTHHGYEDQAAFFAQTLPQLPGLTYHAITGNHDETFEDAAGMLVCRALAETFRAHGRSDLVMHGQRAARLALKVHPNERGLIVDLWHPRGSGAYALSYKLQKKIEAYAPGAKPDVLFCGHYHQSVYVQTRGIHAFQGGTFQGGGGAFGNSLVGSPSIGGWIFTYAQTPDGTVRNFAPEWIGYYEHEQPREVCA